MVVVVMQNPMREVQVGGEQRVRKRNEREDEVREMMRWKWFVVRGVVGSVAGLRGGYLWDRGGGGLVRLWTEGKVRGDVELSSSSSSSV